MVNSISKAKCDRRLIKRVIALVMSLGLVLSLVMIPAKNVEAKTLPSISIVFDKAEVDLNVAWLENEVSARFGESGQNGVSTSDYNFSREYSYLACKESDGSFTDLSTSCDYVSESKNYYYALSVYLHGNTMNNLNINNYKGTPKKLSSGAFNIMVDFDGVQGGGGSQNISIYQDTYLLVSDDGSIATFFFPAGSASTEGRITHITFYPSENVSIAKGEEKVFTASIFGTANTMIAYWDISGNKSANTFVYQYSLTNSYVHVANDETASEITLKAYTNDNKVYKTAKIRIGSSKEISRVDINFDEDIIALNPGVTEGEVAQRVNTASSISNDAYEMDINSNYGLMYDYAGGTKGVLDSQFNGIGIGTDIVKAEKDYYIYYTINHKLGYKWPKSVINNDGQPRSISNFPELSIYTNGTLNPNVYISYNNSYESIRVMVPIDMWKENIEKHSDKLSIAGITDKTYTGSAITQTLTVTFGGKTLVEGTDYSVSYSNNVNVGTANVTVTGIGAYKGSVSKTFKINAPASQGGSTGSTSTTPKYSNEWVNGKWYNADGTQTYEGTLEWKCNSTGWWVEDTSGWYPVSQWQKIDGKWYYFLDSGYMDYSEYRDGYWLGSDGAMVDGYYGEWKSDSKGWWFEDTSGWYPQSQWLWIDGTCYYFGADGYWDGTTA